MNKRLDFISRKIVSSKQAQSISSGWKSKSERIVFTNGCFDILHKGHVTYLAKAAGLGERLIIGLNTDASVRAQGKGADRPINHEVDRALVLAALGFVDLVILFDSDTPIKLIADLEPDILVKGADYNAEETNPNLNGYIFGSDIVRKYGGIVRTIEFEEGYSTTSLIQKTRNSK